jgi:hypothetical protein
MTVFDNMPNWYFLAAVAALLVTATVFAVLAYLAIRKRPFVTLSGWSKHGGFSLEARSDWSKPKARR